MANVDTAKTTDRFKAARDALSAMYAKGPYKDSGRSAEGPAEVLDSYVGAPARQAVDEATSGNFDMDAMRRVLSRIGGDPRYAPTGNDIGMKLALLTNKERDAGVMPMVKPSSRIESED